jgi:hypothetical protein
VSLSDEFAESYRKRVEKTAQSSILKKSTVFEPTEEKVKFQE